MLEPAVVAGCTCNLNLGERAGFGEPSSMAAAYSVLDLGVVNNAPILEALLARSWFTVSCCLAASSSVLTARLMDYPTAPCSAIAAHGQPVK